MGRWKLIVVEMVVMVVVKRAVDVLMMIFLLPRPKIALIYTLSLFGTPADKGLFHEHLFLHQTTAAPPQHAATLPPSPTQCPPGSAHRIRPQVSWVLGLKRVYLRPRAVPS
jgi:hypothetical protein